LKYLLFLIPLFLISCSEQYSKEIINESPQIFEVDYFSKNIEKCFLESNYYFEGKVKILRKKSYKNSSYPDNKIVPYDLVFGWGIMSDPKIILSLYSLYQENRWYHYSWNKDFKYNPKEIKYSSDNIHIIPSNSFILKQIENIKIGDIYYIQGYLVDLYCPTFKRISSKSLFDSGNGACEQLYVEYLKHLN